MFPGFETKWCTQIVRLSITKRTFKSSLSRLMPRRISPHIVKRFWII